MNLSICFLSSELAPFAKTGGLADVSAALVRYLFARGHDVRAFVPLYSSVRANPLVPVEFIQNATVTLGGRALSFSLFTAPLPDSAGMVYFVHCPAFYDRPSLYTEAGDEHLRFALLCRAALDSCQRMGWGPQIFHCNDWQTALLPLYLKTLYGWDRLFARSRALLSIHNIGYQGVFAAGILGDLGLAEHAQRFSQEDLYHHRVNFLKTGILYAEGLSTVSPTYAHEICTAEYGMGLHELLSARRDVLVGILNGVDYNEWSPESDPYIPHHYSRTKLAGKAKNKTALLHKLGLADGAHVPLIGIVSRLATQKGFDLLFEALPEFLRYRDLRLAVLGSGEANYEAFFAWLQQKHPDRVYFHQGFDNELAHLIEAASDLFLMPSRYEPCGLNQMYSLRYGTIPVVRKTGGLADTVTLYDPDSGTGTGIVFEHYDRQALSWALNTAFGLYWNRPAWQQLQQNAMAQDFSWERQGALYEELYWQLASHP